MKFNPNRIFKTKVDVSIPTADGEDTIQFVAQFKALSTDEMVGWPGQTMREQDDNLRRVLVGWDGITADLDGTDAPFVFSPENRDALISDFFVRTALLTTYAKALAGVRRGN